MTTFDTGAARQAAKAARGDRPQGVKPYDASKDPALNPGAATEAARGKAVPTLEANAELPDALCGRYFRGVAAYDRVTGAYLVASYGKTRSGSVPKWFLFFSDQYDSTGDVRPIGQWRKSIRAGTAEEAIALANDKLRELARAGKAGIIRYEAAPQCEARVGDYPIHCTLALGHDGPHQMWSETLTKPLHEWDDDGHWTPNPLGGGPCQDCPDEPVEGKAESKPTCPKCGKPYLRTKHIEQDDTLYGGLSDLSAGAVVYVHQEERLRGGDLAVHGCVVPPTSPTANEPERCPSTHGMQQCYLDAGHEGPHVGVMGKWDNRKPTPATDLPSEAEQVVYKAHLMSLTQTRLKACANTHTGLADWQIEMVLAELRARQYTKDWDYEIRAYFSRCYVARHGSSTWGVSPRPKPQAVAFIPVRQCVIDYLVEWIEAEAREKQGEPEMVAPRVNNPSSWERNQYLSMCERTAQAFAEFRALAVRVKRGNASITAKRNLSSLERRLQQVAISQATIAQPTPGGWVLPTLAATRGAPIEMFPKQEEKPVIITLPSEEAAKPRKSRKAVVEAATPAPDPNLYRRLALARRSPLAAVLLSDHEWNCAVGYLQTVTRREMVTNRLRYRWGYQPTERELQAVGRAWPGNEMARALTPGPDDDEPVSQPKALAA